MASSRSVLSPRPDAQALLGNAALLEMLRAERGGEADFSIQGVERIGESTDERGIGGQIGDRAGYVGQVERERPELLYGHTAVDDLSAKTDVGFFHMRDESGLELDAATGQVQAGFWEDEDGDRTAGHHAQVALGRLDSGNLLGGHDASSPHLGIDLELVGASSESLFGDEGLSQGTAMNAFDLGVQLGTGASADRDTDSSLRLGASAGVGEGFAVHWDDKDGDGVREIGFGIDLKCIAGMSIDFETELLGQLLNAVT